MLLFSAAACCYKWWLYLNLLWLLFMPLFLHPFKVVEEFVYMLDMCVCVLWYALQCRPQMDPLSQGDFFFPYVPHVTDWKLFPLTSFNHRLYKNKGCSHHDVTHWFVECCSTWERSWRRDNTQDHCLKVSDSKTFLLTLVLVSEK